MIFKFYCFFFFLWLFYLSKFFYGKFLWDFHGFSYHTMPNSIWQIIYVFLIFCNLFPFYFSRYPLLQGSCTGHFYWTLFFQLKRFLRIFLYPLTRRTCAYQWLRNIRFSEHLACFVFLKQPFWDLPICIVTGGSLFIVPINRVLPIGSSLFVTKNWRELLTNRKLSMESRVIELFEVETNLSSALIFLSIPKKWKKPRGQLWVEAKLLKRKHMFVPKKLYDSNPP